jgi:2-phosphosulfolactate phosphatase
VSALTQDGYDRRFEWGLAGLAALLPGADVVVVVDVLSFSTAVDIAIARAAAVYPTGWNDDAAAVLARDRGAMLAVGRSRVSAQHPYSLSPASLMAIPPSSRLVLPSPNGAAISVDAALGTAAVFTGCIRNAAAVAAAARGAGDSVAVIAAGEQWPDGSLRPALEDLVGVGRILDALGGRPSPESRAVILAARGVTSAELLACASARELIDQGYEEDVRIALAADVSAAAPMLVDGAFT